MTSKTCNRSRLWSFDVHCSPETIYHFPVSPGEPGKFDFYRLYLSQQAYYSDPLLSDQTNETSLTAPMSSSSTFVTKRRWTPFADIFSHNEPKSSTLTNSQSSNAICATKPEISSTVDSGSLSKTNNIGQDSIQSSQSSSSLVDGVKNAMTTGQLRTNPNRSRCSFLGTTLSSKDLNHLSPQSM